VFGCIEGCFDACRAIITVTLEKKGERNNLFIVRRRKKTPRKKRGVFYIKFEFG
jgi:hypothetical protein